MGLGIIRIFKAFKGITDKYEGTIKCSKKLDETLELGDYRELTEEEVKLIEER